MEINDIQKLDLDNWLAQQLSEDDLCGGRVPTILVEYGKLRNQPRDTHIGTATSRPIDIPPLEAHTFQTLAEYLADEESAHVVVAEVGRLILGGAKIINGVAATTFQACMSGLPHPALAAIVSPIANFEIPMENFPFIPPSFRSVAVPDNQILFVHPASNASFLVERATDVRVVLGNPPVARLLISAEVARLSKGQPQLTRMTII